ncbi:uncharacterized protein [Procambarus clarkii]|uniref:uncharacterized protein n=1 Tax=Procambarus clarkii TaxID=6728 RepID=UPI0037437836
MSAHYNKSILSMNEISEGLKSVVHQLRTHDKLKPPSKPSETNNSKPQSTKGTPNQSRQYNSTPKWNSGSVGVYAVGPSKPIVTVSPKNVTTKGTGSYGTCLFCNEKHSMYHCPNFPDSDARVERLKDLQHCTRCLRKHNINDCDTQLHPCNRCNKGQHHAALCRDTKTTSPNPKVEDSIPTTVQYCKVQQTKSVQSAKSKGNTTLPTAQITILNKRAKVHTRGLFDQGSQRTYITKRLADELQLRPVAQMSFNISGFVTDAGPQVYQVVQPSVRLGRYVCRVQAIVVDKIPVDLQVQGLRATAKFLRNRGIKLADNIKSDHLNDFGLLVGTDYCHRFIGSPTKYQGITMLNSAGGKLLSGPVSSLRRPMPADKQYQ